MNPLQEGMAPEAYTPKEDPEREARYVARYGKDLPFLSKVMQGCFENKTDANAFLKQHLTNVSEKARFRVMMEELPMRDPNEELKPQHSYQYMQKKAKAEANPRAGTMSYMLKQYGE